MVFQNFNLFPHMTVAENIMLAPRLVLKKSRSECRGLTNMLAKVGLADKADQFPGNLSGGQQQRVAIARSLAMNPKVLLCDEITSALDPELVGEVLKVLEQLKAEGMTLVLVTHEMNFARDVGDRIVFMHQGKVWESGPSRELFSKPQTPELQALSRLCCNNLILRPFWVTGLKLWCLCWLSSHGRQPARYQMSRFRKRNALVITETELKLIASAAIIGESSIPVAEYSTPAASGIPSAL